jgi:hypothetical protein
MTLEKQTLEVAKTQIGVQEVPKGSNAGYDIEKYLKSVGLGKGNSWCMAFVFWCVNEASIKSGVKNPLLKTGGVLKQWTSRPLLHVTSPLPGDIFIMDFGQGKGHTGFVESVLSGGRITTIEGNTNDDGSREGYEVCRRTRQISACKGFLRII